MSTLTRGIGGHHRGFRGRTDTWLTPPDLIRKLGPFDLGPCCPAEMPWQTAKAMIHWPNDGLAAEWAGSVWLNPPYGPRTGSWLRKLAAHGNGMALIFARTETADFHEHVWRKANALLFLSGRLHFHRADGTRASASAGGPSVVVAYGMDMALRLRLADLTGHYIGLRGAA